MNLKNKLGKSDILCACDCGEFITIYKRNLYRKPPKYISGHNSKNKPFPHTKESIQKASETKKKLYKLGLICMPSRKGIPSPQKGIPISESTNEYNEIWNF